MKKISLVIFPSTKSIKVDWIHVPRKGEKVYYKGVLHIVNDVYHNIDENEIKVLISD